MSFMDKFKAGVTEAGSKAKTLVEINRLKLQNNSKKSDIEQQYQEIGKLVFDSIEEGSWPLTKEQLEPQINQIMQLKCEIDQNLLQIINLGDEKKCKSCGNLVSVNDRYCSKCGYTFEIEHELVQVIELNEGSVHDGDTFIVPDPLKKKEDQ
ncbi:zinc ribbon domain-containing protein [Paenibacillus sp. N3/727]|uniref:zinc ribbon domain-containing protein n=1 Tax=Paenibacillus sp. N3/727 TaxID=2925845 RepID=UPI001F53CD45|nr:zinc ribbon domain-containing protein [Paenibacillus sp. N3/727]UNK19952.1 zinc ribbon domain-containing protein [Paenibacillus sp. N3/727]